MNTKKIYRFLFAALFAFALTPAFSQFSAGFNLGIPSGDWSTYWNTGFGVDVRYEAPIQDKLNWTASAGWLTFSGKSSQGNNGTLTAIPILAGAKYYFQKSNAGVYAGLDLGLFFWSSTGTSENKFSFSPGLGYRLPKFDFSVRLNAMSDANLVGLRAAYVFPGK
ncbi:MAG TPA: outer membrane beta-barrel protein [Cyclobacteriaceae bacterium]|jgi:hypothetical protein|nr:outer membrane beta-barrel protein [Cyclobacteriaceae bacterium]